jgi:lysophospholipase L1-like esterase
MMDIAVKVALGPVLYRQAHRLRRTALELSEPTGPRLGVEGEGDGPVALRLLVVGDSSAAGVGARTQDDALARPLARHLAARRAGRVHWQLIAETGLTSEGVLHKLMHGHAQPADVAVVTVGVNDITREVPLQQALRKRGEIVAWLCRQLGVQAVLLPGLPEMERFPALPQPLAWYAGRAARRNNRAQARWARGFAAESPAVRHLPMEGLTERHLMAEDGYHPAPALYARVAQRLAAVIGDEVLPQLPQLRAARGRP